MSFHLSHFLVASASAVEASSSTALVGAWHLVEMQQPAADGSMQKVECPGLLTFTSDGHMAVQLMLPEGTGNSYAHGGYEATFGTYRTSGKGIFTYHVDGSLVRDLVGKDFPRAFHIKGRTLEIRSTSAEEHWLVIWQRD